MFARLAAALFASASLAGSGQATSQPLPPLPVPHSNNAVAVTGGGSDARIFSFMGLRPGKAHTDISRQAWMFDWNARQWTRIPDVPVPSGRLASIAATVNGRIYLFGGYSVAENGDEKSTPDVFAFDPASWRYERRTPMPVPVDDSVSLVYGDRYIYLVSGWHDTGNSSLVQVYDTREDRWFRATDWPGTPVFGHGGGIVGHRMVIADGVAAFRDEQSGRNRFSMSAEAWLGEIDPADPTRIEWKRLSAHPGLPRYRMAVSGFADRIIFAGGSEIAYNYNGQGYDGTPAYPSAGVFAYELSSGSWREMGHKAVATMDHRGLIEVDGKTYTVGGMDSDRRVIGDIIPASPQPRP